jgi:AraC-like DNA-binding protein
MRKRLEMAKEMLLESTRKSSQVYLEVGFKDLAHFSRSFKKQFGVSPTSLKKLS